MLSFECMLLMMARLMRKIAEHPSLAVNAADRDKGPAAPLAPTPDKEIWGILDSARIHVNASNVS